MSHRALRPGAPPAAGRASRSRARNARCPTEPASRRGPRVPFATIYVEVARIEGESYVYDYAPSRAILKLAEYDFDMTGFDGGLYTVDGEIGRKAAQGYVEVPEVRLDDEHLVWEWGTIARRYRPQPALIEEFVSLADASPKQIAAFARRRGVLELCAKHDLPSTHNRESSFGLQWPPSYQACGPKLQRASGKFASMRELVDAPLEAREPIVRWRALAAEASAILKLSAMLQRGEPTTEKDWQIAFSGDAFVRATNRRVPWWREEGSRNSRWGHRRFRLMERALIAQKVGDWVEAAGIRPVMEWGALTPRVTFAAYGGPAARLTLFGALALQLLLVACNSDGLAVCSSCGLAYAPNRRPRAGQRAYCEECRRAGIPLRDAKRDQRARQALSRKG